MIGNDVVDLKLASGQSNWRRKGWLQKVFTTSEQDIIASSLDPNFKVWKLWSMKEAAYKAHQRRFSIPPKYNPWDFVCSDDDVCVDTMSYKTLSVATKGYIHTVSYLDKPNFVSKVFKNGSLTYKNQLLQYISEVKRVDSSKISLQKNDLGIPVIYINNSETDIIVSFSSHGLFSSYAVDL
ncbi:4'-phosphopantetheinyl transferase family protein [Aquimarina litoralis]|uniref:4'-phosphopantetheinyl transferase family protein n=1 Tax=Aquimarina litoralis TaxID=584605 RepID=UPI001C58365F|nr:4'-phosphopantetheinyl transferase superfamily protein [Aquimarina litoralis]MBW1298393.1 4'-phosphopantetheinyl transferase superfamily protein [Aquimarina litoralis]